jgi:hypothetical protein
MTERLHPDGLPVGALPCADTFDDRTVSVLAYAAMERRARRREARIAELERTLAAAPYRCECALYDTCAMAKRIAELERTVAWLRSGGDLKMKKNGGGLPWWEEVFEHLASNPPEGWGQGKSESSPSGR